MLFRKYTVILINPKNGQPRQYSLRMCYPFFFCVLLILFGAGNYLFWQQYKTTLGLPAQLQEAQTTITNQEAQLVALAAKAQDIQTDLARVQKFDASLRLMLDVESSLPMVAQSGGKTTADEASQDTEFETNGLENGTSAPILVQGDAIELGLDTLPLHRQELLARKVHAFLSDLKESTTLEEIHQQELMAAVHAQQDILASTPSIWPVRGYITSPFGWRTAPFTKARTFHKGIDIGNVRGTPIVAPANGEVIFVGTKGGYGKSIDIRHANGISTRYAHLNGYNVKKGNKVKRGDTIGYLGNTGRSTGPHLHYEVLVNGLPVNPMHYILN